MHFIDNPLDVFFQKIPVGTALFDARLILQRCNPTWMQYINSITRKPVTPGAHLYELLPDTRDIIQPYINRALTGETVEVQKLRLSNSSNVFYWDTAFAPWIEEGSVTGFLQIVTDITDRVLSQQLLERRVVDRTRKLSALYDVMTVAAELLDLKEILNQSLQRVLAAVHGSAGVIQLLEADGDRLHLVSFRGLDPALAEEMKIMPAHIGLSGWAADQQQPLIISDVATDQRASEIIRRSGLRAYVGVPMNARGNVIGVLSVFRQTKRSFSKEDISLLDSVSDQIGTAIENARLRLENERLLIVEERNRLARELHDAVTQSLYSLTLFAETSRRFAADGRLDMATEYINQAEDTAQQALREMRLLLHNLRPAILEKVGLVKAIQLRLDAVEKRVGIDARFRAEGKTTLPPHVEETLYHITQEALNNALKHAGATEVHILLAQHDGKVTLTVQDNGHGFDDGETYDGGGLGLISMRERVDSLKGTLTIDSAPGLGSRISVTLDLSKAGEYVESLDVLDLLR